MRVVSMAMSSVDGCQMTLLAFDEDESVSEEMYFGDTLYYIVEGGLTVSIDGASHDMHVGDCLAVPAKTPHAVAAIGSCKILQITLTE